MIHFFGDSFTYGQGCNVGEQYYERTYDGTQKTWVELLSEHLEDDYVNHARPGISNQRILDILVHQLYSIKPNDTVVLCRGGDSRLLVPDINKLGNPIHHNIVIHMFIDRLFQFKELDDTYYNSLKSFIENVWIPSLDSVSNRYNELYSGFIKHFELNKIKCIYWNLEEHTIKDNKAIYSIISDEHTDIDDSHWSWKGHTEFFRFIKTQI